MSARLLTLLLCLFAAAPALAVELRIAVSRGPVSLLLYVAESKGFLAAEGLAVRMQECHSGRECFQQLDAGTADLATSAELIVALDSMKAASATILASLSSSTQHIKLVARRSAGIQASADLRGKRIGTVAKTSAQYFLENWLLFNEMSPREVTLTPLPVDRLVEELVARRVDAIAIWEPTASEAAARLGSDLAQLAAPRVYTQHFVLSLPKRRLAEREADIQRLLRALLRAERLVANLPDEAATVLAARLQMDRDAARRAMKEHDFRLTLTPTLLSTMDGQARWAVHEGMAPATPGPGAVLQAISAAPLRKVAPDAVTLPSR